jgi:hypothetical protein
LDNIRAFVSFHAAALAGSSQNPYEILIIAVAETAASALYALLDVSLAAGNTALLRIRPHADRVARTCE